MTNNEKVRKLCNMLVRFEDQSDLEDAMQALVKQDPRLKPILAQIGNRPAARSEAIAVRSAAGSSRRSRSTATGSNPTPSAATNLHGTS